MVWGRIIGQTAKRESSSDGKGIRDFDRLETAFLKMTTLVREKKDLPLLLEHAARESLYCLMAHRSSIFGADDNKGVLSPSYSFAANPQYEQVGLLEEKEVARRTIKQNKTILLREQRDFSEFFKYGDRDRKITSLISIPLPDREKPSRVLSIVLIDGNRRFSEKDVEFLSIFTNHIYIAIENSHLQEEARKAASFESNCEKYLDALLSQLLSLKENERDRIHRHIIKLLPEEKAPEPISLEENERQRIDRRIIKLPPEEKAPEPTNGEGIGEIEPAQDGEGLEGVLFAMEEDGSFRPNGAGEKVRVEFEEDLGMADTNGVGAALVRTPDPMDLGDLFLLRLYLNDGREPMMIQGKVIWTNRYGQDNKHLRRGMGVKFMKLQPEEQKRIEDYNNKRKAAVEKSV